MRNKIIGRSSELSTELYIEIELEAESGMSNVVMMRASGKPISFEPNANL